MKSVIAVVLAALIASSCSSRPQVGGPANPIKAIYIDDGDWNNPQNSIVGAANAGFNVIILAFYMHTGSSDFAQAWEGLDSNTKAQAVQEIHQQGAVLMVSYGGGADDNPYVSDPYSMGQQVAQWAQQNYCDGVDFDVENINGGFTYGNYDADGLVNWIASITQGASDQFNGTGVISHAPQSPYFGPIGDDTTWVGASGGYTGVYQKVGSIINFFNVQYYNQGCYTDYESTFITSAANCSYFPKTAVKEIADAGVDMNKILCGKPVHSGDASDGWVSGSTLGSFVSRAQSDIGWNGGVMGWEWTDDGTTASWLQQVYPGSNSNSGKTSGSSTYNNGLVGKARSSLLGGNGAAPNTQAQEFDF